MKKKHKKTRKARKIICPLLKQGDDEIAYLKKRHLEDIEELRESVQ